MIQQEKHQFRTLEAFIYAMQAEAKSVRRRFRNEAERSSTAIAKTKSSFSDSLTIERRAKGCCQSCGKYFAYADLQRLYTCHVCRDPKCVERAENWGRFRLVPPR